MIDLTLRVAQASRLSRAIWERRLTFDNDVQAKNGPRDAMLRFIRLSTVILAILAAVVIGRSGLCVSMEAHAQEPHSVTVHVFWQPGCPYCERALAFLDDLEASEPDLNVQTHDILASREAAALFERAFESSGEATPAVPLIVIGERVWIGFDPQGETRRTIAEAVAVCREAGCPDLFSGRSTQAASERPASEPQRGELISVPLLGEIDPSAVSLPLLTIALATVDGFNPCAMWVLMFLIGLLLGLEDRLRMWVLGAAFLVSSAFVYFLFMAAWINIFLLLGAALWVRIAIGALALAAGAFYLREFIVNPGVVCRVTDPGERHRLMDRFRAVVRRPNLVVASAGIVILAFGVNLIEFFCSAGLPAIYTKVLALQALPAIQYYLYILFYVSVFLIDDFLIFAVAMVTLRVTGISAGVSRYAHLIGGAVLLLIGVAMLLRPDWLALGG